jgi:hypothetical protein
MGSSKTSIRRYIVSLKLPEPVPALITYATSVVTALTGNAYFASPSPPLAVLTASIGDLHTAEAAALARTKGAVAARDDKRATLVMQLQELKAYVQKTADSNLENGATIIQSAGLAVRKAPVHVPRTFAATPGAVSGSAKLIAASAARRASYEWQYSTDAGKTWVLAPCTLQAKTTLTGLTVGSTVEFRYRPVVKTGEGDWSQTVTLVIR